MLRVARVVLSEAAAASAEQYPTSARPLAAGRGAYSIDGVGLWGTESAGSSLRGSTDCSQAS